MLTSKEKEPIGFRDNPKREKERIEKTTLATEPGIQRAAWDLTYRGAELIPEAKIDMGNPSVGPTAIPGTYTVKLTVDGQTETTTLRVLPDPRVEVSQEDLQKQLDFSLAIRDAISRLTRDVEQIRSVRKQLSERNDLLKGNQEAEPLIESSQELIDKLETLEKKLHNPQAEVVYDILAMKGGTQLYSRMAPLIDWTDETDGPPTQGMREVFDEQKAELGKYEQELQSLMETDLAKLNETARGLSLPIVVVPDWKHEP
jgi:hypothetical protein